MSSGRVWHIGCPGEFIFHTGANKLDPAYMCNYCSELWNGTDWNIAEYRQIASPQRSDKTGEGKP